MVVKPSTVLSSLWTHTKTDAAAVKPSSAGGAGGDAGAAPRPVAATHRSQPLARHAHEHTAQPAVRAPLSRVNRLSPPCHAQKRLSRVEHARRRAAPLSLHTRTALTRSPHCSHTHIATTTASTV